MSWLADPTKFLRRSYRKGDGENQEKVKTKTPKSGKHSSLYSLMQASSSNSLDKSAEETETPSYLLASQVRADELALIRHAANVLISNVPSLDSQTGEDVSNEIRGDALETSQNVSHASEGHLQHSHVRDNGLAYGLSIRCQGNRDDAPCTLHAHQYADFDTPTAESRNTKQEEEDNEDQGLAKRKHDGKRKPCATNEGNRVTEILSPHAREFNDINIVEKGFLFANSDNDDIDESECKVISEDLAALTRSLGEGKVNSPSLLELKGRRKSKGSGKPSKRKNSTDQSLKRESNTRKSSAPEKCTQLSSRKSLKQGEGKMHRSKNNLQTDHSKEGLKVSKDREPFIKQGQRSGTDNGCSSFSDTALTSGEAFMESDLSEKETTFSYMREPTFNHRSENPRVTRREYSLMPQESFAFQDLEGIGERARLSVGHEYETRRSSPTLRAHRREFDVLLLQQEAFQAREKEVMEERARVSFGCDTLKLGSRRSPLMTSSPLILQYGAEQEGEVMGDGGRRSVGHNPAELDMGRSPYAVRPRSQPPSMSPIHQAFTLQEDEMAGERSRTSVGHDYRDLTSRRLSPRMDARNIVSSSIPQHQNFSAQRFDVRGERARNSVGYDAQELDFQTRSPHILGKGPSTPTSLHHNFSLQNSEMVGDRARISMRGDASDFGSRRSPYITGGRELSSPVVHPYFSRQENEGRARVSFGRDDWDSVSRQSPYIAGRRDQSLLPMVSSQRFYLQEDDVMSVFDMPASPFSASQASLLMERGGSMFGDRPVSPLRNSPRFFPRDAEHCYQPPLPMVSRKHFISHKHQQVYNRPSSPYNGVLLHEADGAYEGEDSSPRQALYLERGMQRGSLDDERELDNQRASFYYNESRGSYISRDASSPLMSLRRETFHLPLHGEEVESLYEGYSENEDLSVLSASIKDNAQAGSYHEVVMVQQFLREQREMQQVQEEDGRQSHYDERLSERSHHGHQVQSDERRSESSLRSHLFLKQRSNASSKVEAAPMSPLSATGSLVSSEMRTMKRLKEAQEKVAEVRRAQRGFEKMVAEMVGNGGEDVVHDLLDLEKFVSSYESLSGGGLFKGVVDQFFHELCCELMQPVSQDNDAVLSMALFRLEQICPSS
ncbi:hypothetical protein L7F22_010744 [Adiantum nelumboides]|nr:hypothetical protein [Adiantum nelumboides]